MIFCYSGGGKANDLCDTVLSLILRIIAVSPLGFKLLNWPKQNNQIDQHAGQLADVFDRVAAVKPTFIC